MKSCVWRRTGKLKISDRCPLLKANGGRANITQEFNHEHSKKVSDHRRRPGDSLGFALRGRNRPARNFGLEPGHTKVTPSSCQPYRARDGLLSVGLRFIST